MREWCLLAALLGWPASGVVGEETLREETPSDRPAAPAWDAPVQALLTEYCQGCHTGKQVKGGFHLDLLRSDLEARGSSQAWGRALRQLQKGTMPPRDEPQLASEERQQLVEQIDRRLKQAEASRRAAEGRVVLRRLNRVEYERTVCDLLGIEAELKELLPLDTAAHGFDNIGEALHVSSFLMERYLEAADVALDMAIANRPQPPRRNTRYHLHETHVVKNASERVFRRDGETVVLFSSSPWQSVGLSPFYPPDRGHYRFRISASARQSAGKPVTYRVDAGLMLMTGKMHLVGYYDAPAEESAVIEFVDRLEPRNTIRITPYGLASAQVVDKVGADEFDGPGLAVDWVDVDGPIHEEWPPASHRRIFGDLPQAPAPQFNQPDRLEVVSEHPLQDAEAILRRFIRRAFRRPVTDEEVRPFVQLVESRLQDQQSFEQALRVGLTAVLVSPQFLFLRERPGRLDDVALANRLSYFLWNTMPDDQLLAVAEQGAPLSSASDQTSGEAVPLHEPAILRRQVERLLDDPKAQAFVENFVGQWLGLRDLDATEPSHLLHPEFDDLLKVSMLREVELFFAEVLRSDLPVTQFVASDFSLLNGRLARHYGIPGVQGFAFRKHPLPPEAHRGGVLTMAAVLKVTANGTNTSPVTRGAWVLDRILGIPPPPPPENVAALEPDIRGATTIREQLAKHRQMTACQGCHALIDPPGFALESFDVIGGWRDRYRQVGWFRGAEEVTIDGRRMPYYVGLHVDPSDVLADGRSFRDIDELKSLLLKDPAQIARALTVRLVTYATGGPPETADQPLIDDIVARAREANYGFRALIHAVVQSDLFLMK
ncbi:MAG: DUF1592 domain-containing protein [Planctomycetales bacterium]